MNAERLECLKPDAYLINVGRGVLIDEDALLHALRANRFAGAALDVTTEEPLPSASPLWTMENLFITPHTAGFAEKMWERHYAAYTRESASLSGSASHCCGRSTKTRDTDRQQG